MSSADHAYRMDLAINRRTGVPGSRQDGNAVDDVTPVPARGGRLSHATSFWVVSIAFLTLMSFTTLPTPLYPLYQQRDGFSEFMITVIFAAYGVGVLAGLILAGHISDQVGRRRMILVSVGLELVAAALFTLSTDVPVLLVARFVCGFGIGALTAAATAHLTELHAVGYPDRAKNFAATTATVVNTGGLALGPLIGGLVAQWLPHPLTVPFVAYAVVLAVVAVAVLAVPETVTPKDTRSYHPQRVQVEKSARGEFLAAALGAVAAFSVLGTYTSLAGTFAVEVLHNHSHLVAGLIAFGVMGGTAIAQVVFGGLALTTRLRLGRLLMGLGLLGMVVSALLASLPLFIIGGVIAGAGVGLIFQAAIQTAARVATPEHRAETIAGMFVAAYVGITVPVIGVGLALTLTGSTVGTLIGFAALVLITELIAVGRMLREASASRPN